ncbi:MAG: TolB family protein [Planctomycetaceae bacterium]
MIADADGTNRTVIRDGGAKYQPFYPDWAPDDSAIVFERVDFDRDRTDIVRVDLPGGTLTQLTATPHHQEWAPVFSPDGTTIAYVRGKNRTDGNQDIWTIPAGGGTPTRVTATPRRVETSPDWQAI